MLCEGPPGAGEPQHDCAECGRGLVARFGGDTPWECPSCVADFERLMRAGKLEVVSV